MFFTCAEQDMDDEAVDEAFATASGPDYIKDVLPKFGQRVKVFNARLLLHTDTSSEVSSPQYFTTVFQD